MKLKKIFGIMATGIIAGSMFTGCGGDTTSNKTDGETKIGLITTLNASEQKLEEILKMVAEKSSVKMAVHKMTYYKNLSSMQMGIESGSVDEISTYQSVADYLIARNPKFKVISDHPLTLSDSFCFALRKDEPKLKAEIDRAVASMKKDGTLDKLVKTYITDVKADEPPAVELPHIDGADTIKVAVTGDLPPLDLILADGKPAGFNTAILAEISTRINKNIELLDIDGDARAAALSSGRADVIFWAILPVDDRPKDIDTPEGSILSEPYFTDKVVHLELTK